MATATRREVTSYTVTLELSQEEATHLRSLLGAEVAGSEPGQGIWRALVDCGVWFNGIK